MAYVIIKYLHFIGLFILFSCLVVEHVLVKSEMKPAELVRIAIVDLIYGISAGVVLVAGLTLWFSVGKGADFYSANPIFHIKVTLFVLVGLISIYPTIFFIKHRKSVEAVRLPKSLVMIIRTELLLMLIIPLLAVLMAQGYGISGVNN